MNLTQAKDQAAKMGRKAARTDGWLEPLPQEHHEKDFGDFQQAHRDGWQETDHWGVFYGSKLLALSQEAAANDGVTDSEAIHNDYHLDLLEAFWDAWEDRVGLLKKWQAVQKSRTRKPKCAT